MEGKYVFISYKVEDSDDAVWVKETLESNGIQCWMAPDSIPGGSSYINEIEKAISNCSALVLVLTENVKKSEWIPREINRAADYKKRIMPFDLDNCNLDGQGINLCIAPIQRYDAVKDKRAAMRSMIDDIREEFNAPRANVVFNKKPPKSKNKGEKVKMKLWKKILIGFILIPVIIAVAEFLITFVFTPSEPENNSLSESFQNAENNYAGIFDNNTEKETKLTASTENLLDNLTFELDGVTYSLPCDFSELYANGWEPQTYSSTNEMVYTSNNITLKKNDSCIFITAYTSEPCELINSKVGRISYEPDCNVSFSVNGKIKPGSHYDELVAEFETPQKLGQDMGQDYDEFGYIYDHDKRITFKFYKDTSRCFEIELKNFVYEKEY